MVLEKNKLIAAVQSGFRKQRGTLDHLVRFETSIREAFIQKEHVVSVFFDLESAYDTKWKYGIMNDLHDPFSLRCEADFNCIGCDLEDVANHKVSEVPLWTSKSPTYNYYLTSDKKAITNRIIFKNKFLKVKEQFYTHEEIYTDGSKDGEKVASAAILDGELYQFCLPNNSSIFSTELKAIDLPSTILIKTPIGDTLYILIPFSYAST